MSRTLAGVRGSVEADVVETVSQLADFWCELKLERMRELWDESEREPTYIAEELRDPIIGWQALDEYWLGLRTRLKSARVRASDVEARLVAPDLALVHFVLDWEILPVERDEPFHSQSRVMALLRRTPEGWRFIHYMEAPAHLVE